MKIQTVNSYMQQNMIRNKVTFKEADYIEDYIPTPYEKAMDNLEKEIRNQIDFIKYLYKDRPLDMKKSINEIYELASKKRDAIRAKYLQPKNFFQKLFRL